MSAFEAAAEHGREFPDRRYTPERAVGELASKRIIVG